MKRNRLLLGLFLAVILLLSLAASAWAAPVEFTDVEDTDYEASIIALAYREFIGGYPDGTFRPDDTLMRQQFAKMAVLTMGYEVTTQDVSTFADTPDPFDPVNNPLYPGSYVAVAAQNQIMIGKPGNVFDFYGNVTRQQVITVVVRAAGDALADPPAGWEGDLSYNDATHGVNIKKAEYNGLLDGVPDLASWDTGANATRGEAAELLAQLFYRTGKILTLSGLAGTQEFTIAELKALASIEGYGGFRNKLGNITGPFLYEGIAIDTLIALAGGGTIVKATAADGYQMTYEAEEIAGKVTLYGPADGQNPIFDPEVDTDIPAAVGSVTMALLYETDGEPLSSSEAPLRIGFLSPGASQVSPSGSWARQVVEIIVE